MATALAMTSSPATNHSRPIPREIGLGELRQVGETKRLREPHEVDEAVNDQQSGDDPTHHRPASASILARPRECST